MAIVRRANVILTIKDDQVDRFLNDGYDVLDEAGNVIQKTVPRDLGTLMKAYVDNTAEIKKLKEEIASLKSRKKESVKEERELTEEEPKRRTRKK